MEAALSGKRRSIRRAGQKAEPALEAMGIFPDVQNSSVHGKPRRSRHWRQRVNVLDFLRTQRQANIVGRQYKRHTLEEAQFIFCVHPRAGKLCIETVEETYTCRGTGERATGRGMRDSSHAVYQAVFPDADK